MTRKRALQGWLEATLGFAFLAEAFYIHDRVYTSWFWASVVTVYVVLGVVLVHDGIHLMGRKVVFEEDFRDDD